MNTKEDWIWLGMIVSGVILVMSVAVYGPVNNPTEQNIPAVNYPSGIKRFVDQEAQVVCWYRDANGGTSLSCLPIQDTGFSKPKVQLP